MAVVLLPRTGLPTWTDPGAQDPFTHSQLNAAFNGLEGTVGGQPGVALDSQGAFSAMPIPSAVGAGVYYWTTDTGQLFRSDGGNWWELAMRAWPGDVRITFSPNVPAGYLLCNGSSVLRATYPALLSVIGITYGSVDGTHFNLPNAMDRVLVGAGGSFALGAMGGEINHTLTGAEMPNHGHPLYETAQNVYSQAGTSSVYAGILTDEAPLSARGSGPAGSSGSHNNMQPYITAQVCIKF